MAFAYALDGHKKGTTTKTVLRGGVGFFMTGWEPAIWLNTERFNLAGTVANRRKQIHGDEPHVLFGTIQPEPAQLPFSARIAGRARPKASSNLRCCVGISCTPTTEHSYGASLERQATKNATVALTYLHTFGVHQLVTRDANAYLPAPGTCPGSCFSATAPYWPASVGGRSAIRESVNQYFSEAVYKQDQLIVNVNARLKPRLLSVMGYYTLSLGELNADTGTSFKLVEAGAGLRARELCLSAQPWFFLMANYNILWWRIVFNPRF